MKYIANDISIDPTKSMLICDNGRTGDAQVALYRNNDIYYLETNGDPVVLRESARELAEVCLDLDIVPKDLLTYVVTDVSLTDIQEEYDNQSTLYDLSDSHTCKMV
jgi:hypothetical protein